MTIEIQPPPDVHAERQRLYAARDAEVERQRTEELERHHLPIVRATQFFVETVGIQKLPNLVRILRDANPGTLRKLVANLETAHRQAEHQAREDIAIRQAHDSLIRRQAELDEGAL